MTATKPNPGKLTDDRYAVLNEAFHKALLADTYPATLHGRKAGYTNREAFMKRTRVYELHQLRRRYVMNVNRSKNVHVVQSHKVTLEALDELMAQF